MLDDTVASIELIADNSRLASGLRAAMGMVKDFASGVGVATHKLSLAPKEPKKGQGWLSHAAGQVAGNAVTRGLDLLAEQGAKVFEFNDNLERFGIAARKSGVELDAVGGAVRRASNATGIGAAEILRGTRAYVDMAGAAAYSDDKVSLLARTSQATKADISDLTQVVFQMQHAMKISDADLENSLGGVINMSKDGAVHFSQMATEIAELAPQAARYGMVGRQGINELTAMMQVARTGFGSVSEMGTGITRVFTGLTMHASKFRKYGVEVFNVGKDGTKTWRKFADIFDDIRKNNILSKDPELLRKAFGRSEADRTIRLWMEGVGELRKMEEAGRVNGVVMQDLGRYTSSTAGRLAIAGEKMKNAFAEALTPERVEAIVAGIQRIADAMPGLMASVGGVSDAFGKFAHIVAKSKQAIQGGSHFKDSDEEQDLLMKSRGNSLRPWMHGKLSWREQWRVKEIEERDRTYNKAIDEIMGAETDYGATDESIRRALRYALPDNAGPNGKSVPGSGAGVNYLSTHASEIDEARYKRLSAEVEAEREKAMTPYALTQKRYEQAEREDRSRAVAQAEFMKQHVTPVVQSLAKQLGDIISVAIRGKPTVVEVNSNVVARSAGDATDHRRK